METRVIDGVLVIHLKDMSENAAGYYVTADGKTVYSTKRAKPMVIGGSTSTNGTHYYKFSNNGWGWNFTQREIALFIERNRSQIPATVSIAPQLAGPGNKGVFVIGRQREGKPLEFLYKMETDARAMAEEFAQGEPGVKIVLLQVIGEVVSGGINWR